MAGRRGSTIGANPLDAVIPIRPAAERKEEGRAAEAKAAPAERAKKERVTFQLSSDLIERARDAVYWTPGATLASVVEEALAAQLDKLEKKRGEAFPARTGALKTGRPMK